MKTKISLLLFFFIGAIESFSNPVSIETAKIVAQNFISKEHYMASSKAIQDVVIEKLHEQSLLYVVNFKEGGWVVVSADNSTVPVLAFSLDGVYRLEDEKPEGFLFLISEYMEQIDMAKKKKFVQTKKIKEEWDNLLLNEDSRSTTSKSGLLQKSNTSNSGFYTPGDTLLQDTKGREVAWGQGINNDEGCTPAYNAHAPKTIIQGWFDDCDCDDRPPAGCGAVAMGQIMWYWKWPENSSYRTYNWDLMPYALYDTSTAAQGNEIAHLLRDCGEASNMIYACIGSGTTSVEPALRNSFQYEATRLVYRSEWGGVWNDLIRTEIDCKRPVLYYGAKAFTLDKKHYFIVDGYLQSNSNYFHINFGWRGTNNKHFYLNNICDSDNDTYNDHQHAIIGISPTYPYPDAHLSDLPYSTVVDTKTEEATQTIHLPASGKNLVVENGGHLTLAAGNAITLGPGFHAKAGSRFEAKIDSTKTVSGYMEITASNWPDMLAQNADGLRVSVHNANSFDFSVRDTSNGIIYQRAGVISDDNVMLWPTSSFPADKTLLYSCTARFRNNFGRIVEHTWNVTFLPSKKSETTDYTTKNLSLTATDVTVFPNPSKGTVSINIEKQFSSYNLKVYNITGILMYETKKITQSIYAFDMGHFVDGVYIFQLEIDDQPVSKKVILAK